MEVKEYRSDRIEGIWQTAFQKKLNRGQQLFEPRVLQWFSFTHRGRAVFENGNRENRGSEKNVLEGGVERPDGLLGQIEVTELDVAPRAVSNPRRDHRPVEHLVKPQERREVVSRCGVMCELDDLTITGAYLHLILLLFWPS